MERNIFLGVLAFTAVALIIAILIPGQPKEQAVNLPWQVERTASGSARVFGLTLGESTLGMAEETLKEHAEVSMFVPKEGPSVVEAYFDAITLSGIRAKMVMVVALEEAQAQRAYDRGLRIATLGSGNRKVTLAPEDLEVVRRSPVRSITYIPKINLDKEIIVKRFGEPTLLIKEEEEETTHYLYPRLGVDVAFHPRHKEVIQYVAPGQFDLLLEPLQEKGKRLH